MILVAGGTGRLGSMLVRRLTARGTDVSVLTREPQRAAALTDLAVDVRTGDVRRPGTLAAAMDGVDVVVSAVQGFAGPGGVSPQSVDRDGNAHLLAAARDAGAALVLVSVVGVSEDSPLELFRMKHAAEVHLRASGVPWTIVRASAFADLWIDLLRQTAARSGRPVVFGRGVNPINFVACADVAAALDHVLAAPITRPRTIEVGGPDDLTFDELATAVQGAAGRTSGPRHVPPPALAVMAATVGRLKPELGRQARAARAMDRMPLTWQATHAADAEAIVGPTAVADLLASPAPLEAS